MKTRPLRSASAAAHLPQVLQMHVEGRIAEAASCYEAIVADDPLHFRARHFLGVGRF